MSGENAMCCTTEECGCVSRQFPTKEEKIARLSEYREELQKEMKGVEEAIARLKKD